MCGRFTDMYTWEQIYAYYQLIDDLARNWPANYNVCPTQEVGTIVLRDGRRRFERMRWGIIPWFHKKPMKEWKSATFNADPGAQYCSFGSFGTLPSSAGPGRLGLLASQKSG